ncbi:MAG: aldo/keto reductase [Lachnospiraceae bacterium]|nr:aldo/keto reductase [Lachnospiraceae bacterium]MDE7204640.1 aldo/keto reductase [Lachnospiraceae bacterium]
MEYRKMENLGISTSLLGFGCMRFPTDADGSINEEEALAMIDRAYQSGVTYFDTAYPYHDGKSEIVTGKALARYPRDSYYLATKLPIWAVETIADVERIFQEQLGRLQKDYVDFYLMHALNGERWKFVKELDILGYCERLRADGKIKYLGFSFHDDYEAFEEIITSYKWDFCQIQLNYMDKDTQATLKGVELAGKLGIPLVIMEPVKGGLLAKLPSEGIDELFKKVRPQASTSSWALRYVGSFDNVKVVLSGMSTMEQVEDNLSTFTNFEPLSDAEREIIEKAADALRGRVQNGCTGCRYCMPCPAGVDIPRCFGIWNQYHIYENVNDTKRNWTIWMEDSQKASNCVKCGKCEQACPQHIAIREDLARLQKELDDISKG